MEGGDGGGGGGRSEAEKSLCSYNQPQISRTFKSISVFCQEKFSDMGRCVGWLGLAGALCRRPPPPPPPVVEYQRVHLHFRLAHLNEVSAPVAE